MIMVEFVDILADDGIKNEKEYQDFYKSASEGVLKLPQSYILYAVCEEIQDDEKSNALLIRWSILICIGMIVLEMILHLFDVSLNYLSFISVICVGLISIAITIMCYAFFTTCWVWVFFISATATHLWNMKKASENKGVLLEKKKRFIDRLILQQSPFGGRR